MVHVVISSLNCQQTATSSRNPSTLAWLELAVLGLQNHFSLYLSAKKLKLRLCLRNALVRHPQLMVSKCL